MAQYAERILDVADIEQGTELPAATYANTMANGIVGDVGTNAPNVKYLGSVAPQPKQWSNATIGIYTSTVVEYFGTRPPGR